MKNKHFAVLFSMLLAGALQAADLLLLSEQHTAAVIIANDAKPVAKYAAEELVTHLKKATGLQVPILSEDQAGQSAYDSRIYLGLTAKAAELGLDVGGLPPESCIIHTQGHDLYLLGDEDNSAPLSESNSKCGTLFGVYEILERALGVRWLWPGELGTFVPSSARVTLAPVSREILTPRLAFRSFAWGSLKQIAVNKTKKMSAVEQVIGFSQECLEDYGQAVAVYLRRHRMGGMDRKPSTGHHFTGWWEKHGQKHPDWFMANAQGQRGRSETEAKKHAVPMCVSNPELHKFIVERWDGKSTIRLGEVDWPDVCQCPQCKAWDAPRPEPFPEFLVSSVDKGLPESKAHHQSRGHVLHGFYYPMCTSDRYARFWREVKDLALKRNPETLVTTYLYYTYFPAPTFDIQLGPHVYGEFVPWGNPQHTDFFPMRPEALEWIKQQWLGWQRTGMRIAYRPNYMHDGWVMPIVDTRQSPDLFQFAVKHGMEGSRYDSLTGQWATQGPKLYLHMRLHAKPELEVKSILDEYYGSFGPADKAVRAYFNYWEEYCIANFEKFNNLYIDVGHRWARFIQFAHEAFPPACFPPAEKLLLQAASAVEKGEPEFRQRVAFLQTGLEHAKLAGELAACFGPLKNIPKDSPKFDLAARKLEQLIALRRSHERSYFADLHYGSVARELRYWDLPPVIAQMERNRGLEAKEIKERNDTYTP